MFNVQNFSNDVVNELNEMKKIGIKVPKKVITMAKDLTEMAEYDNMSVSECASLLLEVA